MGDVGVGVLPEREEILIGAAALFAITGEGVCTAQFEISDGPYGKIADKQSIADGWAGKQAGGGSQRGMRFFDFS